MLELSVSYRDDLRHVLQTGEHEASHFILTDEEGKLFGYIRTLFSADDVLEIITLRVDDRTWVHQARYPIAPIAQPTPDASAPYVHLMCEQPWDQWRLEFQGLLTAADGEAHLLLEMQLTFSATTRPIHYAFGPSYQQVQQDGNLRGTLRLGDKLWRGPWIATRDRSWGRRPMTEVFDVTVVTIPEYLYAVITQSSIHPSSFGYWMPPSRKPQSLIAPELSQTDGGWRLEDPESEMPPWMIQRIADPLIVYYGRAGQESVRNTPQPGDLLRDELGPARFIQRDNTVIGFFDQLKEISLKKQSEGRS